MVLSSKTAPGRRAANSELANLGMVELQTIKMVVLGGWFIYLDLHGYTNISGLGWYNRSGFPSMACKRCAFEVAKHGLSKVLAWTLS